MRHERGILPADRQEAARHRLLAKWDAHLEERGALHPVMEDFLSFGSLPQLERLRDALNRHRPNSVGDMRLALRRKRSEKWRKTHPEPETRESRKPRGPTRLSMAEADLPRPWRRALREMRTSRTTLDRGLLELDDRTPPSATVICNLASTLRVFGRVCVDHSLPVEMTRETIDLYRAARHAEGNVSVSIAGRLKELLTFARWCEAEEDVIRKLVRLHKLYAEAAKGERKRKDIWAAKHGEGIGEVWTKAEELLALSQAAPEGSMLRATLTLDAACLALSVVCPLRCGDLHRIEIGTELARKEKGWSLYIETRKTGRPYHRPELWPELTPFLDAVVMLDQSGRDFHDAYVAKHGTALFSRDGGASTPAVDWPSRCWFRHFEIGAHIVRSLWHSLMFESEDDEQWIALALCGQGNARTAQEYILEGRKKRAGRRGRAKIRAIRQARRAG